MMYKVVLECRGAAGDGALTYRVDASSAAAADFHACQRAGNHSPDYTDIHAIRIEVEK